MDTIKGHYTYGEYWGYVGKGEPGANKNGEMRFETEREYEIFMEELKSESR